MVLKCLTGNRNLLNSHVIGFCLTINCWCILDIVCVQTLFSFVVCLSRMCCWQVLVDLRHTVLGGFSGQMGAIEESRRDSRWGDLCFIVWFCRSGTTVWYVIWSRLNLTINFRPKFVGVIRDQRRSPTSPVSSNELNRLVDQCFSTCEEVAKIDNFTSLLSLVLVFISTNMSVGSFFFERQVSCVVCCVSLLNFLAFFFTLRNSATTLLSLFFHSSCICFVFVEKYFHSKTLLILCLMFDVKSESPVHSFKVPVFYCCCLVRTPRNWTVALRSEQLH